jgi:hypothetical protein
MPLGRFDSGIESAKIIDEGQAGIAIRICMGHHEVHKTTWSSPSVRKELVRPPMTTVSHAWVQEEQGHSERGLEVPAKLVRGIIDIMP